MNKPSRIWLFIALALAAGLAIGYLVGRRPAPPAPPPSIKSAEEALVAEYRRVQSLVDEAVRQSLADLGAPAPQVLQPEARPADGKPETIILRLPAFDAAALRAQLQKRLAAIPRVGLNEITPKEWQVSIDGVPTHRLLLHDSPKLAQLPKARLALIIDDMGEDVKFAKGLAALSAPVAFSVWPDSSQREAVLKIAKAGGREILIHLPMQPKGYPQVNPGPHALLVSMTPEQIKAAVHRAAEQVHGSIGVNNHMGSEFTESSIGMRVALGAMHDKGLFFLDSRTTAATVGEAEARRMGLRHFHRDVFLDNEQDVQAILKQLKQAEAMAKSKGQAIAIGHPHPATLEALKQWLKAKDPAVHVVPLTQLSPE